VGADRQCRDVSGCTGCAGGGGRLSAADLAGQTFTWQYDKNDRVTTETNPGGFQIGYGYDAADADDRPGPESKERLLFVRIVCSLPARAVLA
jgi:hypothetical protein